MTAVRAAGTHAYMCECTRRKCRERLFLAPGDYERLSQFGSVLAVACATETGRTALIRFNGAVAVSTFLHGGGRVFD